MMMRATTAILGLVALVGVARAGDDSAVEKARRMVARCQSLQHDAGGRAWLCDEVIVAVGDDARPIATALDTHVAGLRRGLGAIELQVRETRFRFGKESLPARELAFHDPRGVAIVGTSVARALSPTTSRTVSCSGTAAARAFCDEAMPLLLTVGPQPLGTVEVTRPFATRSLRVPDGCTVKDGAIEVTFDCGKTGMLSYFRLKDPSTMDVAIRSFYENVLAIRGAMRGQNRPCRMAGVATTCYIIEVPTGMEVATAGALVDGIPMVASCTQSAHATVMHRACASVFQY